MAKFKNLGNGWGKCINGRNPGCGSTWRIRVEEPIQCPRCHHPFEYPRRKTQ